MAVPTFSIIYFNNREQASPVGFRTTGLAPGHPAFISFLTIDDSDQSLNYGTIKIDSAVPSLTASRTQAFCLVQSTFETQVNNIRVWLPSGINTMPDRVFPQFAVSGSWVPNFNVGSGVYPFQALSMSFPTLQNLFRQDRFATLSGVIDSEATQFVYTNLIIHPDHPMGDFGIGGSGTFRPRIYLEYLPT